MNKRPWVPVAVVLLVLIGATLVVGSIVRSRLAEADLVLAPFMRSDVIDIPADDADLPSPPCRNAPEIADAIRGFYEMVEIEREQAIENGDDPEEILLTNPSFDSFFLDSAIARVGSGQHEMVLNARTADGDWCLDEVTIRTEE